MKIAIVGSRSISDYDLFTAKAGAALSGLQVDEIISGGAPGADTLAKRFAAERGIPFREIKADWRNLGKRAGFIRNGEVVNAADYIVALWDGVSRGTLDTIERTKTAGKPFKVIGFTIWTGLDQIKTDWEGCLSCPLGEGRTRQVWGRALGDLGPGGLVLIGEAPGENEDREGLPFIGRAGKHLDGLLIQAGIKEAFITNVVLCRPPGNRRPEPGEVRACWGRLVRTLEALRPGVIVAVGGTAAEALTGKNWSVGKFCRSVLRLGFLGSALGTVPVVPIYHPSYLLREHNPDLDAATVRRLQLAGELTQ